MLRIYGISVCAGESLRCAVLTTSLYTAYYLGSCVPCALRFIPLADLFRIPLKRIGCMVALLMVSHAHAESVLDYLTDANGKYIGPSVEDQVALMDKDHNGFADVFEVRAYLESQHGKGYQKALLDRWELSASGKSCSTPFAKELYSEATHSESVAQP